jgi:predicted amidophosphoribosyltransferase
MNRKYPDRSAYELSHFYRGLCIKCPNPAAPGRKMCEECLRKNVEQVQRYRARRKEAARG